MLRKPDYVAVLESVLDKRTALLDEYEVEFNSKKHLYSEEHAADIRAKIGRKRFDLEIDRFNLHDHLSD